MNHHHSLGEIPVFSFCKKMIEFFFFRQQMIAHIQKTNNQGVFTHIYRFNLFIGSDSV
jgi:hypothetical protein